MSKIKTIEINLPMQGSWYTVGQPVKDPSIPRGKDIVTEIKDASIEFESSIDIIYHIYVSGQLWMSIENTPVSVIYEIDGDSNGTN